MLLMSKVTQILKVILKYILLLDKQLFQNTQGYKKVMYI